MSHFVLDPAYVISGLCGVVAAIATIMWRREISRNDRAERRLDALLEDRFETTAEAARRYEEAIRTISCRMDDLVATMKEHNRG